MKKQLLIVALTALASISIAAAPAGVEVVHVFPGQNGPHPPDAPAPSVDTIGGVGPKHLVGFINGGVTIRSKADGKEVVPYQTQRQFWEGAVKNTGGELPPEYPYDPRIVYDPLTSRWFALAGIWRPAAGSGGSCCGRHILIGVSTDDDPTHPWKALDFATRVPVDNVKLGVDRNGVYMTEFGLNTGEQPRGALLAVPMADLLWKGNGAPSLAHLNRLEIEMMPRLADNKFRGIDGIIPAIDFDAKKKPTDPEFCVNRYRTEPDGETIIQVRKVTWTSPTQAALGEPVDIGVGAHYPVQPTTRAVQPALTDGLISPGLAAGEGRLVNVALRDGTLWTTAATEINNRDGAFWVEIDLKTMKLTQHGEMADPDADILFPSLNVDARGNLGIVVMRSSANEAASTYVTGRLPGDPPNQLRSLVRAVQGRYPYVSKTSDLTKPNQAVSTSDFAATSADPSDPTLLWSYQFAALNDCMPKETNGGKYAVNWVAFRIAAPGAKAARGR